MSFVQGTVTAQETSRGIAGLIVSAIDIDDDAAGGPLTAGTLRGQRLGSTVTGPGGSFRIEYDVQALPLRSAAAPTPDAGAEADAATDAEDGRSAAPRRARNIALTVTAAESGDASPPLFSSQRARLRSGQEEAFAITLPVAALLSHGIAPPAENDDPDGDLAGLRRDEQRRRTMERGRRGVARSKVAAERAIAEAFDKNLRQAIVTHLSPAPAQTAVPDRRVVDPADVIPKNRRAMDDGMAARFQPGGTSPLVISTRFHLDGTQQRLVETLTVNGQQPLGPSDMRRVLLPPDRPPDEPPAVLVSQDPVLRTALERTTTERLSRRLLGLPDGTAPVPGRDGVTADGGATVADGVASPVDGDGRGAPLGNGQTAAVTVAGLLDRVLQDVSAPEGPVVADPRITSGRPDQESVQDGISGFAIRPGPADVPALFDFHRLQIAFEHVWQDVVDDDIVDVARDLDRQVRLFGGKVTSDPASDPIRRLTDEARLVQRAGVGVAVDAVFAPNVAARPAGGGNGPPDLGVPHGPELTDDEPAKVKGDTSAPGDLLSRLLTLIQQSYPFTVYGAAAGSRSVNFGIVATYRQTWTPVTYQTGSLIKTIPLTPGESRKVSRRTIIRRKRSERTLARWDSLTRDEMQTTTRAESEIVRKAMAKTNFALTAEGTYNLGVAEGDSTTQLGRDAATDSADTKRNFREAVIKAAQEYKQERSTELTTEDSGETEDTDTSEIKNDNNELHVTYLFYELQRRYRIHERLHRVTPVVLVAQEVPNPSEITDAFVLAHDWILRRVLLDERLLPALDYLSSRVAGDRLAVAHLKGEVDRQRVLVDEVKQNLLSLETQATQRYEALLQAIKDRATEIQAEDNDGFFSDLGQALGIGDGQSEESAQVREDAARDAEQRAAEQVKELQMRLQREVTALNEVSERYARLLSDHRNLEVQVARLQVHVRQNILYYMQAIWSFEMPHQRFLRLHQVLVPRIVDAGTQYAPTGTQFEGQVTGVDAGGLQESPGIEFTVTPNLALDAASDILSEVADLDTLLGFHGNYMVFPLKRPNPLSEVLMAPYVDSGWRLMDPDEPRSMTLDEFASYVLKLHEDLTPAEFTALKEALNTRYAELLLDPRRQGEEIVVPTDSLYIDALPGTRPLLEDFKLLHRALDVKSAQAKTRQAEIENLRFAARLVGGLLEDPEVDKRIVVEGAPALVGTDN